MFNSVGKEVEERLTGMVRHLEHFSYRPSDLVNDKRISRILQNTGE